MQDVYSSRRCGSKLGVESYSAKIHEAGQKSVHDLGTSPNTYVQIPTGLTCWSHRRYSANQKGRLGRGYRELLVEAPIRQDSPPPIPTPPPPPSLLEFTSVPNPPHPPPPFYNSTSLSTLRENSPLLRGRSRLADASASQPQIWGLGTRFRGAVRNPLRTPGEFAQQAFRYSIATILF